MTRAEIALRVESLELPPTLLLLPELFDPAIMGVMERQFERPPAVIYNEEKVLQLLCEHDNLTFDEALEHYEFNIKGAWMGDYTPIYAITGEDA